MRLSEDEILNLFVHDDVCVRRLALSHFSETNSSRTDLFSKTREAWEKFGTKEAFGHFPDLAWLSPPEDALPWLVEELEAQPAPKPYLENQEEEDETQEDIDEDIALQIAAEEQERYGDGLQRLIFKFSPTAVRPFAERLSAAVCVDESFRERLQWNLEREHATAAEAWNALLKWQTGIAAEYADWDEDEEEFDIADFPSADAWCDVLLRNIHAAPQKAILNHLREVYEECREFPDDLLAGFCLQAIAAGNWSDALSPIAQHWMGGEQEMSTEAESALARFPAEEVLPYVQNHVAQTGTATADMALMLLHFRSPEVLATARAMLPIVDSKLTAGILCEALCLQFDREALELAAETSREQGIGCLNFGQLIGGAAALNVEHADLPHWKRLQNDDDARNMEITQLMIESMECGPDCGHDHSEDGDELEGGDDEAWLADDDELDPLDEDSDVGVAHLCGPDCGHDHGHDHNHAPRFIEPLSPDTFKHDTIAVGRNEPCPCGSGKKFKKCCMRGAGD